MPICDTDFVGTNGAGGGKSATAGALADHVGAIWGDGGERRLVVVTGGEPMLQLDDALVAALTIAVFGWRSRPMDAGCDAARRLDLRESEGGDGGRAAIRQRAETGVAAGGNRSWSTRGLEFEHFLVQTMDAQPGQALDAAIALAMARPRWRLSLQAHKVVGLP